MFIFHNYLIDFQTAWQVIALTQTQLDEAMKPAQFDLHPPAGDTNVPSPSILAMDRSFSSAANPISSLLAGEKIQFGEYWKNHMHQNLNLRIEVC